MTLTAALRMPAVSQVSSIAAGGCAIAAIRAGRPGKPFRPENRHGYARACDGGGVNPRDAERDRGVVDEQSGFEIVRAVENQRKAGEKLARILGREIRDDAFDSRDRIDGAKPAFGGDGFRQIFAARRTLRRVFGAGRLDGSTKSRSIKRNAPMPARTEKQLATAVPMAPQPTRTAEDSAIVPVRTRRFRRIESGGNNVLFGSGPSVICGSNYSSS